MFLGNLLLRPVLVGSGRPTAAPCLVCNNFRESMSGINPLEAKRRASAGCLGCKLIVCACQRFLQKKQLDWGSRKPISGDRFQSLQEERLLVDINRYRLRIRMRSERFLSMEDEYEIFTTAKVSRYAMGGLEQRNIPFRNSGTAENFRSNRSMDTRLWQTR